ncbi:hypothetical protein JRQ81_004719, partial [Phrynocephalus forsythii]
AGQLAVIEGEMDSQLYQKILLDNMRRSVCYLKLCRSWVMKHNHDSKYWSKYITEWLQKTKICLLEWP